jgi:ATP-dependent DNA helicase RecG
MQPVLYIPEDYENLKRTLLPVYPKTGLSAKLLRSMLAQSLEDEEAFVDYLPETIRKRYYLCELNKAYQTIHFPKTKDKLLIARRRLVFDEFFLFLISVEQLKENTKKLFNSYLIDKRDSCQKVINHLSYSLTKAQSRTLEEIFADMGSPFVMNRLVQGDVGCGKTILAFLSMLAVADSGYQSALMAPTEVLARQHYEGLLQLLEENQLPYRVSLLVGSMTAKEKRIAYGEIEAGEVSFVVGTHALIQEKVVYNQLALVITDEQHRFGVRQREDFSKKSEKMPHVMVMSATPIPRTLAIILYGDLDISVVDEMPAYRLPIKNCAIGENETIKAWKFMAGQVEKGHQAYVICSMVEESETLEAENVGEYYEKLNNYYQGKYSLAILHGKMKAKEKDAVMQKFFNKEVDILISTTVVEVGVNVPNATVILVENAERFGLSQLHQLRGRVGRGNAQSYCIFINHSDSKVSKERLNTLVHSNDGFYIASEDLKQRGPGDFYGVRQSGELAFNLGDIYTDAQILKDAKEAASELIAEDNKLEREENQRLKNYFEQYKESRQKYTVL